MSIEKEYVDGLLRKIERLQAERDAVAQFTAAGLVGRQMDDVRFAFPAAKGQQGGRMNIIEATAQQLAWERGRDDATETDAAEAAEMVQRWNQQRIERGLVPLE